MKYILFLIVVFFSSFNLEYREKYVCHATLVKPAEELCLVVVVRAETKEEAEVKFKSYVARKQKEFGGNEYNSLHILSKLKDAIMIEP